MSLSRKRAYIAVLVACFVIGAPLLSISVLCSMKPDSPIEAGDTDARSVPANAKDLWENVEPQERTKYLDDLLGDGWSVGSPANEVKKTRLAGMTKREVVRMLGPPLEDEYLRQTSFVSYKLGVHEKGGCIKNLLADLMGFQKRQLYLSVSVDENTRRVKHISVTD